MNVKLLVGLKKSSSRNAEFKKSTNVWGKWHFGFSTFRILQINSIYFHPNHTMGIQMIDKRLNFCFDILYRRTLTQSQSEEKKFGSFTKPTTVAKAHRAQIYAVWKAVCSTSRVECSRQCGRQCRFYNTVESSVSPAGLSVVGSNQCQRRVQPPTMMQMLILYTYLYI